MEDIRNLATIGIFGGSGFYKFLDDIKEYTIETPYGLTSDTIAIGSVAGKRLHSCLVMVEIIISYHIR